MSAEKIVNYPKHIAIVMDGNRRWAKQKGKALAFGHKAGAENAKKIAQAANELGIKYLTLYAFSTENWNRSKEEVSYLLGLLTLYIENYQAELEKNKIRLNIIGDIDRLPKKLRDKILALEENSLSNSELVLTIAISYGGRGEIFNAAKKLANYCIENKIEPSTLKEKDFTNFLDTKDIPDPDIFIRPSGEYRISNFLLWQIAYSELYFTDKLWPDFDKNELEKSIQDFLKRERRYGE